VSHHGSNPYPTTDNVGTHMQKRRPAGGYPANTIAVREEFPDGRQRLKSKSMRRAEARLTKRNRAHDEGGGRNRESKHLHHRPGAIRHWS